MVCSVDLVSSWDSEGKSCFENDVLSEDVNTDVRRIEGPREGCIHGHVLLNKLVKFWYKMGIQILVDKQLGM
jgi:hypothetical protein